MNLQIDINKKLFHTLRLIMIISLFFVVPSSISSQEIEKKPLHQYEFIMHLIRAMQIEYLLPENPTINDYIKLLESKGIKIPGGYKPDEFITTKQMAIMLVPAMGLEKARFEEIKSEIREGYRDRAIIIDIVGKVTVKLKDSTEWKDAKPGIVLTEEDTIKTEKNSKLIIRIGEISVVTIKEDTTLTLYNLSKEPTLYIEKGEIIMDTHGSERETPYYVVTPTTVTAVRGTIIRVVVSQGRTILQVISGEVVVGEFGLAVSPEEAIDVIIRGEEFTVTEVEVRQGESFESGVGKGRVPPKVVQQIIAEDGEYAVIAETDLNAAAAIEYFVQEGIISVEAEITELVNQVEGPPSSGWASAEAPAETLGTGTEKTKPDTEASQAQKTYEENAQNALPSGLPEPTYTPPSTSGGTGGGTTTVTDYFVSTSGNDSNDGQSWATAFLTIGQALSIVNADTSSNTITIHINGNFTIPSALSITRISGNVTLIGNTATGGNVITATDMPTITSGAAAIGSMITISGSVTGITIQSVRFQNSLASAINITTSGTVTVSKCIFDGIVTNTSGVVLVSSGTVYIINSLFFSNTNTAVSSTVAISGGTVFIRACTFTSNTATVGLATAIYYSGGTLTSTGCIFANNQLNTYEFIDANTGADPTTRYCHFYNTDAVDHYYDAGGALTIAQINALPGNAGNQGGKNPGVDDPSFKGATYDQCQIGAASPCLSIVPFGEAGMPSDDIRYQARDVAANRDIGCYEYTVGDPPITGRVYDSVTGETISSPVISIYSSGSTTALSTTISNPYTFNVDPGNYFIAVSKDGYAFPSQIVSNVTAGDHGDVFTASDTALNIDIPMDPDGWLYVEKTVNKKRATLGEIVTYNIKIQNKHWFKSVSNVELVDEIVNGFKYAKGSTYISSSKQTDPIISNRKAVFNLGTVSANSTTNLSYQVRVGTSVPNGRYKASANTRKSTTGERNSNTSSVSIEVVEDPLFTRGTIIGKVFFDLNGNGIQDSGEKGIGDVIIATEYGVVIETDQDGKYHIADVPSGNHLLKVDPSTLPEGAGFTTDNPYFVKITEGLLAKVNFGLAPLTPPSPQGGEGVRSTSEGANKFFIVALGEGIVRNLDTSGNIEMMDKDNRYDDGIKVDGRLSFYLKGKVLGKYLVTACVDTDRRPYGRYNTKDLFTNLDPDKYYPVYGDAGKVDYSGVDTQDMVFVLIEWDESFAKWGSFHTELPLYNRTLSGGIINYQSVGKTKFGDPWTIVKGFGAMSRQKAAHDEFVGTGGSLYYLRHDNVVEGSEKIQVEVRDRVSKTSVSTIILSEEKDYEIDYDTGRILLRRSLNSIQQQYTRSIISNDILMGERVYLVVNYEYISDSLSNEAWGVRASQQIGHYVRVGGQYVEEQKEGDPYQLAGGDATIKINKDTAIDASYTHTKETQIGSEITYDGGLTFNEQLDTLSDGRSGSAVSVGGRTKLFGNTDVNLSYSRQDPYYSVTDSISSQGSQKYIAQIQSNLTKSLSAGVEHVTQRLLENTIAGTTIGAQDVHTTTAMVDYEKGKWALRGEYQHQDVSNPIVDFTYLGTLPFLSNDFIAARVGYQLFNWLHPYIRGQVTVSGEANDQGTVGADINVLEDTSVNIAETVGTLGNSTAVGVTTKINEDTDVYANLEVGNHMMLGKYTKTTYGQSSQLGPDSRAYMEEDYSSYRENVIRGNILGYDKKITDTLALGLTYERSNLENSSQAIDRDAGSISLSYLNTDWLKAGSKVEVRNDKGMTEVRQWVTENDILWRVTDSISLTGRGNWGWTHDLDAETDEAEFYELGSGFSLRPVTWDKLNIIGKYSYLTNLPPESQWDFIETTESQRHVYAIEGAFDVFRYLQLVGKFAYRDMEEKVGPRGWTQSDTYLYIGRTNFHIMNSEEEKPFLLRGWDFAVEYRILANDQIEDSKEGWLLELDKDLGNYVRAGVGYNFTDYDDDLRNDDNWDAKGWFVRINGKY